MIARPRSALAAVAIFSAVSLPAVARAQSWRTVELARQLRDSAEHQVHVRYGRGRFTLLATDAPLLYDARIRYDESRATPRSEYDAAEREVEISVAHDDDASGGRQAPGDMRLALSPHAPIHLELELGAVESEIDLGGLSISELSVDASASEALVTFDEPNRTAMRVLDLHARAASVTATRLANANAAEMRIGAGVGNVELDFGGRWTTDVEASIDVAMGRVHIRVPEAIGVRVEVSRVLASFEHPGFEKQGDAWVSANWDDAEHHLTLHIDTAFGTVQIERGGD